MGELARRRHARDLWVSPGQVRAAVAAGILLGVGAFLGGYLTGSSGRSVVGDGGAVAGLAADLPDEALLDLLARLDATTVAEGVLDEITYDALLHRATAAEVLGLPDGATVSGPLSPPDEATPSEEITLDLGAFDEDHAEALMAALLEVGVQATPIAGTDASQPVVRLLVEGGPEASSPNARQLAEIVEGVGAAQGFAP